MVWFGLYVSNAQRCDVMQDKLVVVRGTHSGLVDWFVKESSPCCGDALRLLNKEVTDKEGMTSLVLSEASLAWMLELVMKERSTSSCGFRLSRRMDVLLLFVVWFGAGRSCDMLLSLSKRTRQRRKYNDSLWSQRKRNAKKGRAARLKGEKDASAGRGRRECGNVIDRRRKGSSLATTGVDGMATEEREGLAASARGGSKSQKTALEPIQRKARGAHAHTQSASGGGTAALQRLHRVPEDVSLDPISVRGIFVPPGVIPCPCYRAFSPACRFGPDEETGPN